MVCEHDFKKYIEGKRVAFIGPAPNLIGKRMGPFFDSFDVCVRTNHSIELIKDKDFQKDYGSKCHVLYTNSQYYREMHPFPVNSWIRYGLEWMCMKQAKGKERQRLRKFIRVRRVTETIDMYKKRLPSVLMGVILMSEIAECRPDYFYVDGIDFNWSRPSVWKDEDNYPEYVNGYLPEAIIEKARIINAGKIADGHDPIANTKEIYSLWKGKRLYFPEHLSKLLCDIVEGKCKK